MFSSATCPKRYAGSTLTRASLKFLYSPFRLWVAEWVQVLPLTVGAYFSCTHGTLNDELKGQLERLLLVFDRYPLHGPLLGRLTYLTAPLVATGQPRKVSVLL